MGICRDTGKEHGNYYTIYGRVIRIMEKKMATTMLYLGVRVETRASYVLWESVGAFESVSEVI